MKKLKSKLSIMNSKIGIFTILAAFALTACGGSGEPKQDTVITTQDDTPPGDQSREYLGSGEVMKQGDLTLTAYKESPKFDGATLKTTSPKNGEELKAGNIKFSYDIQGFELGAQTEGAGKNSLANSGEGQHIHAILNNEPYMAHYEPGFDVDLKAGHYVLLSFLSRSYHESLKNREAYELIQFTVGNSIKKDIDLSAPHIFYSRPKGTYKGDDTNKLLLDFYLVNCTLSKEGYKVRATINGNEFMITDWSAYVVEGLEKGKVDLKLELLDRNGSTVNSPFNPTTRTVTLE